jgi:glycosyltransferase involved in cell wall biosynthesis
MITHVDCIQKVIQIKNQLNNAKMGICMSKETTNQLIETGIPKEKLCYINPAQDGLIKPRKLILGLTHKTHHDFRKNPYDILKICDAINPTDFAFKIMGSGWDKIIEKMRTKGFSVEYYDHFDRDIYCNLMPSLDYYVYFGFDEGSMGYLDALAAGIKTIVTPQGYHLDTEHGITHPVKNTEDIVAVLQKIAIERKLITDSVSDWTWEKYAKNHLNIWQRLIDNKNFSIDLTGNTRENKLAAFFIKTKRLLFYFLRPLTVTAFLWSITPKFLKDYYKKNYFRSS